MLSKLPPYSSSSHSFSVDYEVKNKIGEGTFSEVWLCVQRNSGQEFAAKILKKNYGETIDATMWDDISEVNVLNAVGHHPFLLKMVEAHHERQTGRIILITELMKKSLYDIIEVGECPLSDYRVKIYMYQMLEGLKYMHENGFIHRDIKPENILLKTRDKFLKIGDFGTTCNASEGQPYTEYVATRWYRSPECLLTRGWYGSKMDVWATGCVLFEIATGKPLFDGQDENDQMDKIDRVLSCPDYRLFMKFKKHKSDVFIKRYETCKQSERVFGAGLHTVYQPYRPAYEILKDMIVYDPVKRFSADRLLRKPYFYEMRHTQYNYKMREFEEVIRNKSLNSVSSGEKLCPLKNKQSLIFKKQGPAGDRISHLQTNTVVNEKIEEQFVDNHIHNINSLNNQEQSISSDRSEDSINIREPENIYPKKQNQNLRNVCQKTNIKTICSSKKLLTNNVSTYNSRTSITKNVKNIVNNTRPPFK